MTLTNRSRARAATLAPGLALVAVLISQLIGPSARAQMAPRDTTLDVQLFQPAIGPRNFVTVEGTSVAEHKRLSFGLYLNYQTHPYVVFTRGGMQQSVNVVDNQTTAEANAAIGLFGRYQVGLALPYTLYLAGDQVDAMGLPRDFRLKENGIGDLRIEGKMLLATLGEDDEYTLALSAGLSLPTGKSDSRPFLGDKMLTGRIKVIGGAELGKVRLGANLGILIRQTSEAFATELGPQVLYALAAAYPVAKRFDLMLEGYGRSGLNQFADFYSDVNPFEVDVSGRFAINGMWSVLAGGGRGFGSGVGAPDLRLFAGAQFNPDYRDRDHDGIYDVHDRCPDEPEDRDGFQDGDGCPDKDNDNDTIPDAQDKCPNEGEDLDQFEDEDGCPELDNDKDGTPDLNDACPNAPEDGKGKRPTDGCPSTTEDSDGDGVPDVSDKCADEPEDKDNFQDDDGCDDPDNDADGIPDNFDNCPNDAEDPDGFEDEDGCPDPDNDKDGIADAVDRCPTQAETLNGNKDDDGCPDPGAELVRLVDGKIELDERIGFSSRGGKMMIKEGSTKALNLVALLLKGHAELTKVRIEVHAEGITKEDTQRRADTVRDFLVSKGVAADRLTPVGLGPGSPRVEFVVDSTPAAPAPAPAKPAAPNPTK
jgi:outer membrane protein OmpA-like peptidoglycan-associated protein